MKVDRFGLVVNVDRLTMVCFAADTDAKALRSRRDALHKRGAREYKAESEWAGAVECLKDAAKVFHQKTIVKLLMTSAVKKTMMGR